MKKPDGQSAFARNSPDDLRCAIAAVVDEQNFGTDITEFVSEQVEQDGDAALLISGRHDDGEPRRRVRWKNGQLLRDF